jgi:hypothetical protein
MRHRELEQHQEREAARTLELLEANTALTRQTEALAEQIPGSERACFRSRGAGRMRHRVEDEAGSLHADAGVDDASFEVAREGIAAAVDSARLGSWLL